MLAGGERSLGLQSSRSTKGSHFQYRINGYRDVQRRSKAFEQAAQILHLHQVLTDASDLPEITTAPHMDVNFRQLYSYRASAGISEQTQATNTATTCSFKHIASRGKKAARNTFRSLKSGSRNNTASTKKDCSYSKLPKALHSKRSFVTSQCTLPVSPLTVTATSHQPEAAANAKILYTPSRIEPSKINNLPEITAGGLKCQAWLRSCEPWWRVNDEYPVHIPQSKLTNIQK